MVKAHVKPIAINHMLIVNFFAMNAAKTALMCSWCSEEIARIDPAQRNSDTPCAYISVVNESSQRLYSLLSVRIRLLQ